MLKGICLTALLIVLIGCGESADKKAMRLAREAYMDIGTNWGPGDPPTQHIYKGEMNKWGLGEVGKEFAKRIKGIIDASPDVSKETNDRLQRLESLAEREADLWNKWGQKYAHLNSPVEQKELIKNTHEIAKLLELKYDGGQSVAKSAPKFTWVTITSKEGNYSALFPKQPTEEVKVEEMHGAKLTIHLSSVKIGDDIFVVAYWDYPRDIIKSLTFKELVDPIIAEAVKKSKGELQENERIRLFGIPGREIKIIIQKEYQRVSHRFYLDGNRMYQTYALVSQAANSRGFTQFQDSFRLLNMRDE